MQVLAVDQHQMAPNPGERCGCVLQQTQGKREMWLFPLPLEGAEKYRHYFCSLFCVGC